MTNTNTNNEQLLQNALAFLAQNSPNRTTSLDLENAPPLEMLMSGIKPIAINSALCLPFNNDKTIHVILDFETFAQDPHACIWAVALTVFAPNQVVAYAMHENVRNNNVLKQLSWTLDSPYTATVGWLLNDGAIESQLAKNRSITQSTIDFVQQHCLINNWTLPSIGMHATLYYILQMLAALRNTNHGPVILWSKGANFDIAILEGLMQQYHYFEMFNIILPYPQRLCLRTLIATAGAGMPIVNEPQPDMLAAHQSATGATGATELIRHHPIYDTLTEVHQLINIWYPNHPLITGVPK